MSALVLFLDVVIGFCIVLGTLAAAQIVIETRRWSK